ncbi:hypothetical protein ACROYT_G002620 [Oculina patagonica]
MLWCYCTASVCHLSAIDSRQAFGHLSRRRVSFVYHNHDSLWSVLGYTDRNKRGPTSRLAVDDEFELRINITERGGINILLPENFLHTSSPEDTVRGMVAIAGRRLLVPEAVAASMVYLNSSLNPLFCCWKMKEIRHEVKQMVRQTFCPQR